MPSLADLQNIRVVRNPAANIQSRLQAIQLGNNGGMPQGGYSPQGLQFPQGFGGFNSTNIQNMLAAQNQLSQYQREQDARAAQQNIDNARGFSLSGGYDPGPMRQMTGVESGLKKASDFTQGLVNMTGWDPNKGFTPGNILRFGASLPFQMAQGVTEGSEQLYEAATGRPLLQADSETGLIGTNTLDASQRAADVANAAINIGGLFTGGSARAIGTGANILSRGKAGARMAEGMFGRAMKSPVGQIGYDVAEEGGEEFVQQYLDDTRMKQLDEGTFGRALEGAKWGALGGGMMSGTSLAVNKALGKSNTKNMSASEQDAGSTNTQENGPSVAQEPQQHIKEMQDSGGTSYGSTKLTQELANEVAGEVRRVDASTTAKMRYADHKLGHNDIVVGAEDVYYTWRAGKGSQSKLARMFRCTEDELEEAILSNKVGDQEYSNLEDSLNALRESKIGSGKMVIGVGRNPDTNNGGFYMNIARFTGGSGIDIHPWVAPLVGSDFDGDTATLYFDRSDTSFLGTPIEMMRDPEAMPSSKAAAEGDWAFAFVDKNLHSDKNRIRNVIRASLGDKVDQFSDQQINTWVNNIAETSEKIDKGEASVGDYAQVFYELTNAIASKTQDRWVANDAVSSIMHGIESDGLADRCKEHFDSIKEARDARVKADEESTVVVRKALEDRGVVNAGATIAQIIDYVGGVVSALTSSGNPIFRQYSMLKFDSKQHTEWISSISKMSQDKDTFSALIRMSFRMAAPGQSPLSAAEGVIEAACVSRTLNDWGTRRIKSQEDVDAFIDIYTKHHDELVEIYNDAVKQAGTFGIKPPYNSHLQKKFSEREDADERSRAINEAIIKSFDKIPIDMILDARKLPVKYQSMTVGGFLSDKSMIGDGTVRATMLMDDPGVGGFVKKLIGAYQTQKNGAEKSVEQFVRSEENDRILRHIVEDENGNYKIDDDRFQWAVFDYIDSIAQILSPKIALRAGFYGLEILKTRYGKMVFDQNADVRLNGIVCISLATQFDSVRGMIKNGEYANAQRKLISLRNISPLHQLIADRIMPGPNGEDISFGLLDLLVDPDVSWTSKEQFIEKLSLEISDLDSSINLLDCLLTEDSTFAISGLSNRVREARDSLGIAVKNLFDSDINEVNQLKDAHSSLAQGESTFVSWFTEILTDRVASIDTGFIGAQLYAANTLHNSLTEKGTNIDSAVQAHAMLSQEIKGRPISYLDDITSENTDAIEIDAFCTDVHLIARVLADPTFRKRVVDPITGRSVYITRAAILADVGMSNTEELSSEAIFRILEKWPQLAGWLTERAIMPTKSEGGTPGSTNAKAMSLSESYTKYVNGKNNTDGTQDFDRRVDNIKRFIGLKLLNQSWYKPAILSIIAKNHPEIATISPTVEQWTDWANAAHQEYVDGIFSMIISDEQERTSAKNSHFASILSDTDKMVREIFGFAVDDFQRIISTPIGSQNYINDVKTAIASREFISRVANLYRAKKIEGFDEFVGTFIYGDAIADTVEKDLDSTYNAFMDEFNNITDALKKVSALMAFSLGEDPNFRWKPDQDKIVREVYDDIELKLKNDEITQEQHDYLIDGVNNITSENYSLFADLPSEIDDRVISEEMASAAIFDDADGYNKWINAIVKIKQMNGEPIPENLNELSEAKKLKKIFDKKKLDDLKGMRTAYNAIFFRRTILDAIGSNGFIDSVNVNAVATQIEYRENLDSFLAGIAGAVKSRFDLTDLKSAKWSDRKKYTGKDLPVPIFTDKKVEAVSNMLKIMDQSAFVPQTVSVNGGMTKKMAGFGLLSRDTMSPVPPRVIDREILANAAKIGSRDKFALRVAGQELTFKDLRTAKVILREFDKLDPNAQRNVEIVHFHPADNPHGVYDSHTPNAQSLNPHRYKRLPGILARIIDFSQEAMVLKAKKTIKSSAVIVSEDGRSYFTDEKGSADLKLLTDSVSAMQTLKKILLEYRQQYQSGLAEVFAEEQVQNALGFNSEQAMIIAQGLTPGFIVTYKDGTTATIDARHVFIGQEDFNQRWNEIIGYDSDILSIEVLSVTPTEASMRIMRAASKKAHSGEDVPIDQQRKAADDAMNNWDDYVVGNLPISEVMSHFRHLGYSYDATYIAPDWRTPVQYAIGELYGQQTSAYNGRVSHARMSDTTTYMEEGKEGAKVKRGGVIAETMFSDDLGISQVFLETWFDDTLDSPYSSDYYKISTEIAQNEYKGTPKRDGKVLTLPNAAGLFLSDKKDKFLSAVNWAVEADATIFMPKTLWDRFAQAYPYYGAGSTASLENKDGIDFIAIHPRRDAYHSRMRECDIDGPNLALHPDDILGAMVDIHNWFKLGDASGAATKELAAHIEKICNSSRLNLSDLFDSKHVSVRNVRIANREEALDIIDEISRASKAEDYNGDLTLTGLKAQQREGAFNAFKGELEQFGNKLRAEGTDKAILRDNVTNSEIIALIYDENSGQYAPIYAPHQAMKDIRMANIQFDERTGDLVIRYAGNIQWDEFDSWIKMSLEGEAMKMMMHLLDDKEIPEIDGVSPIHMIVSPETENGRIDGMEEKVKVKDIYYLMRKVGGSLFFDIVDGKPVWKSNLNLSDIEKEQLMHSHRTTAWTRVSNGLLKLIPGDDNNPDVKSANRAVKQIVRNCLRYNIDPISVFSTFSIGENGEMILRYSYSRHSMIFNGVRYEDIVNLHHFMNPKFIPSMSMSEKVVKDGEFIMDKFANTRVKYNGEIKYVPVRWGVHQVIGDESSVSIPSGMAKYSPQHLYRRAADYGYMDKDWQKAIDWSDYMLGNIDYVNLRAQTALDQGLAETVSPIEDPLDIETWITSSYSQLKHIKKLRDINRNRTKIRRVYDGDEVISKPWEHEKIKLWIGKLKGEFDLHDWTWAMFMSQVDRIDGYTYDTDAHHEISVTQLAGHLETLYNRIKNEEVPVGNSIKDGVMTNKRYALSALSNDEIDFYWRSKHIQKTYGYNKENFKKAVAEQADNDYAQLEYISDPIKRKALETAFEADFNARGEYGKTGYIANAIYLSDIVDTDELIERAFGKVAEGPFKNLDIDRDTWNRLSAREREVLRDFCQRAEQTKRVKWVKVASDERGKRILKYQAEDGRVVGAVLDTLTETTKVMALLNPMVFISNVTDRFVHQGIMRASLWLGNALKIGPYAARTIPPAADNIEIAVNNQYAFELYTAMRLAQLTGESGAFLAEMKTAEEIQLWKKNRLKEMTPAQRARAKIFDIQTGSDWRVKDQFRNFLYRFYQFAEATPGQEFWTAREGDGPSFFETMITQDHGMGAAKFLLEVFGGHGDNSTSFTIAMQALNSAQKGDMAQRNVYAAVLKEMCKGKPLANLIVTSCISRFPEYSFNVTSRMLNWILPMSSINYVVTEKLAEYGHNKAEKINSADNDKQYTDPHFELYQEYRDLKEAMLVDITHLGVGAVTMILLGMSGGIEPPDDEKKWGNTDEWLVFGHRAGDAWWIQDILGIALPMAAFTRSAQLGKPRMDILVNGVTKACCSNPIIKVADAVGWISDPDGSLVSRYDRDYEQYKEAKGGPPGFLDWMNAQGISFGLNWISQFFTPSCVREWYQNAQQWERSYKRVYQTNPDGSLSELGQQGYTEYTTYADAQIRRATRRNPILGFLADLVLSPTTGYLAGEMPMTVYTDDYQRESGNYWTINGLEPEDQQAKILEIICEMQKYDNMDELVETGFYLDNETRAALGSTCWDIIHEWDNWYYGLQEDGWFDYYTIGEGDFQLGQEMVGSIKKEWNTQRNAWQDFYYDKVCNLPTSMTTYNRYNTTYEKDVYGNIYASGYRQQGFLPFVSAPGTTTNPEGTAGYGNDFMTVSAVTGQPMQQRALVPAKSNGEMMPSLDAFSGDGNGSGYSKLYESWYGSDGTTGEGNTLSSGLANNGLPGSNTGAPTVKNSTPQASGSSKKSSSRSRGGGGGYRRRGGGGGGGGYSSTPNIYARYQAPYAVSANVMGRVNRSRSNFDYLRPSWETKGSREAYKREDI